MRKQLKRLKRSYEPHVQTHAITLIVDDAQNAKWSFERNGRFLERTISIRHLWLVASRYKIGGRRSHTSKITPPRVRTYIHTYIYICARAWKRSAWNRTPHHLTYNPFEQDAPFASVSSSRQSTLIFDKSIVSFAHSLGAKAVPFLTMEYFYSSAARSPRSNIVPMEQLTVTKRETLIEESLRKVPNVRSFQSESIDFYNFAILDNKRDILYI